MPSDAPSLPDADFFWEQLKTVLDPEVNVNVVDLGLIYGIEVGAAPAGSARPGRVSVQMTLTSPTCPMGDYLLAEVEKCLGQHPAVETVRVELVWEPPWHRDMITEAGRMELGWL